MTVNVIGLDMAGEKLAGVGPIQALHHRGEPLEYFGGDSSRIGLRISPKKLQPLLTTVYTKNDVDTLILAAKEIYYSQKQVDEIVASLMMSYEERILELKNDFDKGLNKLERLIYTNQIKTKEG